MNNRTKLGLVVTTLAVLPAYVAGAADAPSDENGWTCGINYRLGLNIKASFLNAGRPPYINNPSVSQAHPTTYDGHSYYDGFIGIDDANNAPAPNSNNALTSNFGFESSSQLVGNPNSGYLLQLSYSQAGALGAGSDNIDLNSHGFEITFGRQLHKGEKTSWGIEFGVGYAQVCQSWAGNANGGAIGTDLFPIRSGVQVFDQFPYPGYPDAGFGNPLMDITAGTALPTFVTAKLDADLYSFRAGPYLKWPVSDRVSIQFGGGLSAVVVDGSASFVQTTPPNAPIHMDNEDVSVVFGGYLAAQVSVKLSEHWDINAGVQYHILDKWSLQAGDKIAEIDMGGALYLTVGVSCWF